MQCPKATGQSVPGAVPSSGRESRGGCVYPVAGGPWDTPTPGPDLCQFQLALLHL